MKRFVTVLSMLLLVSLLLAVVAPTAWADEAAPITDDRQGTEHNRSIITWTPPGLTIPIAPGETVYAHASFTSRLAINQASLVVSFPLSRYVQVTPTGTFTVVPGTIYPVELTVHWPDDVLTSATVMGTIHVVGAGQLYGQPLSVTLVRTNLRPPIQWTPAQVKLFVDVPVSTGTEPPPSSTVVSFTSSITITNARLRATAPLNHVLDVDPVGPITILPHVTYTVTLTAHQPVSVTAMGAGADLDTSNALRVVSGLVEIFDAQRVYPKTLPVTVVLGAVPVPPLIAWRPPVVVMHLERGQAHSQVVTMTSTALLENATLRVTGPISPYLTVEPTGPLTIQPTTPYQVTLRVAAVTNAPVNRPLNGEVAVVDSTGRILRHALKVMVMWRPSSPSPTP